jgi:hypothetical protein
MYALLLDWYNFLHTGQLVVCSATPTQLRAVGDDVGDGGNGSSPKNGDGVMAGGARSDSIVLRG